MTLTLEIYTKYKNTLLGQFFIIFVQGYSKKKEEKPCTHKQKSTIIIMFDECAYIASLLSILFQAQ